MWRMAGSPPDVGSAIPVCDARDYVTGAVRTAGLARGGTNMISDRLHHDIEVAERTGAALLVGLVMAAFVALAIAATIYDIGKWFALW